MDETAANKRRFFLCHIATEQPPRLVVVFYLFCQRTETAKFEANGCGYVGVGSPSGRPLTFDCPCAEFFNSDSYSVNSCYDKWLVFRIFSFHKLFSIIRSGFFYFKAYSVSKKNKEARNLR